MDRSARRLRQAVDALGAPTMLPSPEPPDILVAINDIDALLQREQPLTEANQVAAELLTLAARIRREKSFARSERAKMLLSLCHKLIAVSESNVPQWIGTVRSIVREELSNLTLAATAHPATPEFDASAFREIVANGVRSGVIAAGRDRWSAEPLSEMIARFLKAQYPSEKGKSKVGSKHREDVERRLALDAGINRGRQHQAIAVEARPDQQALCDHKWKPLIAFDSLLPIGIRLDQARVNCEPFAADQSLPDAAAQDGLEHATEEIALTEAAVPVLRERRVIGDSSIRTQPAEPAVCQIEVDFIAEASLRSDAEAVPDQEHPDHQLRIDRGPPDVAVEGCQLSSKVLEVDEPIDRPQEVVGWDVPF